MKIESVGPQASSDITTAEYLTLLHDGCIKRVYSGKSRVHNTGIEELYMKKKLKLFTLIIPILIIEKTSTLPPFSIKLTMLCGACTITTGDKPSQTAPFTNLQDVIDRNHEEISKLLTENSDIYDPLPFSFCSGPAIFDLAKSNKNKGLVEIILNRPEFSIDRLMIIIKIIYFILLQNLAVQQFYQHYSAIAKRTMLIINH